MNRQSAAIDVIGLFAQEIEQLRVDHGDEEIEGGIGVTHDEEQCCLLITLVVLALRVQENLIAQGVKLQLVIHGDLSKLRNVKGGKPGTAGHEDGFRGLASCQAILCILADCKMVRVFYSQLIEHLVHGVFILLIVFSDFHGVNQFKESREVLFLRWSLIVEIADQCCVQQGLCLRPELVTRFPVPLGVGNERRYQFQNILFSVDIHEGVVVHTLLEIDGVEDLDPVVVAFQQLANLAYNRTFRVCDDIGGVELHEIWLEEKPGLTGTGAADDEHILISRVSRVFGAIRHHQAFGLREDDIVLKDRIDKWGNVFGFAPSGRAVFLILTILLCVFAFDIDNKADDGGSGDTDTQIDRMETWHDVLKCHGHSVYDVNRLGGKVKARSKPCGLSELCRQQRDKHIRDIRQNHLLDVYRLFHRASISFFRTFGVSMVAACSLSLRRV